MKEERYSGSLAAVRRSFALVEAVSGSPDGLSYSEIAERLSLSPASLSRLLKVLAEENWLRQERPNGRYGIGHRALRMAHRLRSFGLHGPLVQGAVTSLAYRTGHSACIASFQGDFFVLIAKYEMPNSYHFIDVFAPNTDWTANGMGQLLLAHQPRTAAERIYQRRFDHEVPADHLRRFEDLRQGDVHVSEDVDALRVMIALRGDEAGPATHVLSVAIPASGRVDVPGIAAHLRESAVDVARRLAASAPAPEPAESPQDDQNKATRPTGDYT